MSIYVGPTHTIPMLKKHTHTSTSLFTVHFPCYKNVPIPPLNHMIYQSRFSFFISSSFRPALMKTTQNNTFFYTAHHRQQPPSSGFNLNIHQQQQRQDFDFTNKEHMFEKPLTPSDVGKLNRLVIPKQHAETHFPLLGGADQQKGLLLTFEDECGKLWRFRYSYWNSSQSYVLTKGWSRYVKDKSLDAGDVVLFERHMSDCDRMFIYCRRRMEVEAAAAQPAHDAAQFNYPLPLSLPLTYQHDYLHAGEYENVDSYKREVVATRRLRLFGVNLECPDDSEPSTSYGSSQGGQLDHQYHGGHLDHQYI